MKPAESSYIHTSFTVVFFFPRGPYSVYSTALDTYYKPTSSAMPSLLATYLVKTFAARCMTIL